MPKEEIEFVIRPDGTVEERTQGLKGEACEQVTARIEQTLGRVVSRETTAERYEPPAPTAEEHRQEGA
ncbi:MAG: DUF2997 domain-containing protein [Armatimonadetes bacterium]|nr:DUF2997 domain-containing protein [Armatimonadota bacterium]